jgi:hypothetical protein
MRSNLAVQTVSWPLLMQEEVLNSLELGHGISVGCVVILTRNLESQGFG